MKKYLALLLFALLLPFPACAACYGRLVLVSDGTTRVYDVIDTSVYNPRPSWAQNDDDLLQGLFKPNVSAWQATNQWFVPLAPAVKSGAVYLGGGQGTTDASQFINPDNTDGNGSLIQPTPLSPYYSANH